MTNAFVLHIISPKVNLKLSMLENPMILVFVRVVTCILTRYESPMVVPEKFQLNLKLLM